MFVREKPNLVHIQQFPSPANTIRRVCKKTTASRIIEKRAAAEVDTRADPIRRLGCGDVCTPADHAATNERTERNRFVDAGPLAAAHAAPRTPSITLPNYKLDFFGAFGDIRR